MAVPRFSIVLPCLTDAPTLTRCLDSLGLQTFPKAGFEIVVVDDFSQPELQGALLNYRSSSSSGIAQVKYVRNPENFGRAKTRNRGIEESSGEVVLFMDVDQLVDNRLLEALDSAIGGDRLKSVRANSSVWPPLLENSAYLRYYDSRFLGKRPQNELDSIDLKNLPAKYFASGCIAVTRAALDLVGGFDEEFRFYGCEDEELGTRLEAAGVPLSLCLEAKAYNVAVDLNVRRVCNRFVEYAQRSVPILLNKHPAYARQMSLWFLELPTNQLSTKYRIIRAALIGGFRPAAARLLVRFLEHRDARPGFNPTGALYKLAITGFYLQGYRQRKDEVPT